MNKNNCKSKINSITQKVNIILLALIMLSLTACAGSSPLTTFYVLDSPKDSKEAQLLASLSSKDDTDLAKIQIRTVSIPSYLDRNAIVSRAEDGVRLELAEFDIWAESLESGAQRLISQVLTPVLLKKDVLLQPLDDSVDGPLQLFVQVQRLDGILNQNVVLEARWTLRNFYDETVARGAFLETKPTGMGYASFVKTQSDLLTNLAKSMVNPILKAASRDIIDKEEYVKHEKKIEQQKETAIDAVKSVIN